MGRTVYPVSIDAFIVSVVVIRGHGPQTEVLLMRRRATPTGTWAQVAGKIEAEETAWQAARRELAEETGLSAEALYCADTQEQFYEAERDAITVAPVFVARVAEDAQVAMNDEHDALRWLSFDAAIDLVDFGGQRRMLRDIKEDFVDHAPSPHQLMPET